MKNPKYNLLKIIALFFVAVLFLPGFVGAATYYVKPDGNDNLDGRSDATAWKTIGKVNKHSFGPGDDVYFKCGGTWTGSQLRVDWSGNEGNRAVIGAYYMSGNEVIGVSGNKPIIDGNNVVPVGTYQGLIYVYRKDYVTVENIKVVSSTWDGVRFQGTSFSDRSTTNNAINIDTDDIYKVGVKYEYVATGTVEGCDVTDACRTQIGGGDWPAAVSIMGSDNITIKKNTVHENYGEGIGIYTNSDDCIVEDNICYANKKVGIYIDHSRGNIIRRNLCYGTTDSTFHRTSWGPGMGIGVSDESWLAAYSENNRIHDNLIAYCSTGIILWTGHSDWPLKDTLVYNNTIVDCRVGLDFSSYRVSYPGSAIKNNIFWGITGGDSTLVTDAPTAMTFDYNLWSSEPTDNDAKGANDPSYALPLLTKTSGWRSMTGGDLTGNDFTLQDSSPAINVGADLGSPYNLGLDPVSIWPNNVKTLNQNNYGNWEIGAFVFGNSTKPTSPTNVRMKIIP